MGQGRARGTMNGNGREERKNAGAFLFKKKMSYTFSPFFPFRLKNFLNKEKQGERMKESEVYEK